jgi:8-oxo-dGTP pyrophosphatase MutT (NUDIX family)
MADYVARARDVLAARTPRQLAGDGLVPAAVLVLLAGPSDDPRIVLTVRTDRVEHHKGQISFPGGAVHPADADLATTALRETEEEIGVAPEDVELLGQLDDMVTISDFLVTPFVGRLLRPLPYAYVTNPLEVAEVIEPPLSELLTPSTLVWESLGTEQAPPRRSPAYYWRGYRIWGATGRMLHGFLSLLTADSARV